MKDYMAKSNNNKIESNDNYIFTENDNQTKIVFLYNLNSNGLVGNIDIRLSGIRLNKVRFNG